MSRRLSAQERALRTVTEAAWLSWVQDAAKLYGFRFVHFRPAKTDRGWRTPVQGDGAGFPDCLLLHPDGRAFAIELKREVGGATPEQEAWLAAFRAVGFVAEVWRPRDRDRVVVLLQRPAVTTP